MLKIQNKKIRDTAPINSSILLSSKIIERSFYLDPGSPDFLTQLLYFSNLIEAIVLSDDVICIDHHNAARPLMNPTSPFAYIPHIFLDEDEADDAAETMALLEQIDQDFERKKKNSLLSNRISKDHLLGQLNSDSSSPLKFIPMYNDRSEISWSPHVISHLYHFFDEIGRDLDVDVLDAFYELVSNPKGSSTDEISWERKVDNATHTKVSLFERQIALEYGYSYHTDASHFSAFAAHVFDHFNNIVTSELVRAYELVSQTLADKQRTLFARRPSASILLPVIPSIVFARAKNALDIVPKVLELRHDPPMQELRATFRDYETIIRDSTLPMNVSITALERLDTDIARICERLSNGAPLDIKELRSGTAIAKALSDGLDKEDAFTMGNIFVGKPLGWLIDKIKTRHVHYFFRLGKEFLENPETGNDIKRIFGVNISKADVRRLQSDLWTSELKFQ